MKIQRAPQGRWMVELRLGTVTMDPPDGRAMGAPRSLRRILRRESRRAARQVRAAMQRSERVAVAMGVMHWFPVQKGGG